jgi:hypothetical protein
MKYPEISWGKEVVVSREALLPRPFPISTVKEGSLVLLFRDI